VFDFLGIGFVGPRGPGGDAPPGEQAAAGVVQLLFPTLIFCLMAFSGLRHNGNGALAVGLALLVVAYVIGRVLSGKVSFALLNVFLGAVWIFVGALVGGLLGGLIDFYATF
jgi:uncharacterized membrane protein YccC